MSRAVPARGASHRRARLSSERDPRPHFDRFQALMDRMDPASIDWWADSLAACRHALAESRASRLAFETDGQARTAEEIAQLEQREMELERLAKHFDQLRNRNRLPRR